MTYSVTKVDDRFEVNSSGHDGNERRFVASFASKADALILQATLNETTDIVNHAVRNVFKQMGVDNLKKVGGC